MSNIPELKNSVRERRVARGWSQQQLADRAAIARASVSAIEMGRLVPSASAALALAAALDCRVEDIFQLGSPSSGGPDWAWQPARLPARYWQAEVAGRDWLYPVEPTYAGTLPHDGLLDGTTAISRVESLAPTLVMATCDPAVGLLSGELARASGLRLLPLSRSSRAALRILQEGKVHVAGLHLGPDGTDQNVDVAREMLGPGYRIVRVAAWDEGIVTASDRKLSSPRAARRARFNWVGREPGSGARQCFEEVLGNRISPRHIALDHRGVAEAVRAGWADAGICLRLVGEEASLEFLHVRSEAYDLCYSESLENDARMRALLAALRGPRYRGQLADLSGYRAANGEIVPIN
jgi:molybdate-binding protein/DNA-binding XRE family transcriptional regulator